MKLALLCRPHFRSPRVLAESLQFQLRALGAEAEIFFDGIALLNRLLPLREAPRHWYMRPDARLRLKLWYWRRDRALIRRLRTFDAVVLCECTPNGFWRGYYGVEALRAHLAPIPVLYHSVFYFNNAPRDCARWLAPDDHGPERYDWHLAVSPLTEIALPPAPPWSVVGLHTASLGISPQRKQRLTAILDFAQPGSESLRTQLRDVLTSLQIPIVELAGDHDFAAIRRVYEEGSLFFLQHEETFGVSIAENLAAGNFIFSPDRAWPMAWRLNPTALREPPPDFCDAFRFYTSPEDLRHQLQALQKTYDPSTTPARVVESFTTAHPHFVHGDPSTLRALLDRILRREF